MLVKTVPRASKPHLHSHIERVLRIHFDADGGTPFWLERQRELGIDVRRDVRSDEDLLQLGAMDEQALANRPIEDFVPRSMMARRAELLIGETAGTLGQPKFAVHRSDEFVSAFVEPFVLAAQRVGFPRGLNWLFVGPSGPHLIGQAAHACSRAMGSRGCFAIDLDPRWAKNLPAESFARRRYVQHLEEQALTILQTQQIGVLFSTPAVLHGLGPRMDGDKRHRIRGVHLGGLAVSPEHRAEIQEWFPRAVILSGYGNTLLGVMPELSFSPRRGFSYFPHARRLLVRVVPNAQRLSEDVSYGKRGQVVVSRFDETQLIINLVERDSAVRLRPPPSAVRDGFISDGVGDPQPIVNARLKPAIGIY